MLQATQHVYVCDCSRSDIARRREATATGAHSANEHGAEWYPGRCRQKRLAPGAHIPPGVGIRVVLDDAPEPFDDEALGSIVQIPARQCGDLLLRDRDGNWTYQFAVTVDDINDRVTLVVRGLDLLSSTGRQIKLARMLGRATPPHFFHHPLIVKADGQKLSKASGDSGVRELRASGVTAAEVIGRAAAAVGLIDRPSPIEARAAGALAAATHRGRASRTRKGIT
jgi:glutamyl-tRNA synthetase/glutamyl-Q tRNA(Asp) synthetase